MSITTGDAILSLHPTAKWSFTKNTVTWISEDITEPTALELSNEVTRLQAVYDAKAYQRERRTAYPNIGDQLDSLYHDILNNKLDKTGTWFTGITDVKNTTTLDEILLDGTDGSSTNAGDKVLLG